MANPCMTCALADWKRTAAGRLHPDGSGKCLWRMPTITLPKSRYYLGFRENAIPQPHGGGIERNDDRSCLTYQPMAVSS